MRLEALEPGARRLGAQRERAGGVVAQPRFERREEGERGDGQRRRRGREEREHEPGAQPGRPQAASRYPAPRTVRISSGRSGVGFELLAQVADVHVDAARVAERAVAPDRPHQLLAVEQAAGRGHQRGDHLELAEREADGLAVLAQLARAAVERERAGLEHVVGARAGSAQHRADAAAAAPPGRRACRRSRPRRPRGRARCRPRVSSAVSMMIGTVLWRSRSVRQTS